MMFFLKFTWVRSCHKSGCVLLSKEIQKDSGQVYLYLAFEINFNPKVPKVQDGRFFCACVFYFSPKFLQIHLMPAKGNE